MNKQKHNKPKCAGAEGVSRGDLLKGLTFGTGGVMAAPLCAGSPTGQPVSSVLNASTPTLLDGVLQSGQTVAPAGLAGYGGGWVFVRTQTSDAAGNTTYDIQFVDVHSLNSVFSFGEQLNMTVAATPSALSVSDNTYVYTA